LVPRAPSSGRIRPRRGGSPPERWRAPPQSAAHDASLVTSGSGSGGLGFRLRLLRLRVAGLRAGRGSVSRLVRGFRGDSGGRIANAEGLRQAKAKLHPRERLELRYILELEAGCRKL